MANNHCKSCGTKLPSEFSSQCEDCQILVLEQPAFVPSNDYRNVEIELKNYQAAFDTYQNKRASWYQRLAPINKQVDCIRCGRKRWSFVLNTGGFICSKCHPNEYEKAKHAKGVFEHLQWENQPVEVSTVKFLRTRGVHIPQNCTRKQGEDLVVQFWQENHDEEPASIQQRALLEVLCVSYHFAINRKEASDLISRNQKKNPSEEDRDSYYERNHELEASPSLLHCAQCGTKFESLIGPCPFCYRKDHPILSILRSYL